MRHTAAHSWLNNLATLGWVAAPQGALAACETSLMSLQGRGSCYWYGRRVSCAQYRWQAYAAGSFAGAHFCSTICRSLNARCAQQTPCTLKKK